MNDPKNENVDTPSDEPEVAREGDVRGDDDNPEATPTKSVRPSVQEPDEVDFNELDPKAKDRTWGS